MKLRRIASLSCLLLLAGCDLFGSEPDTRVVATGTVVLEGLSAVTYRVLVNAPWRHDPPTPYTDRTFDVAPGDTLALGVVELSRMED